MFSDANFLLAFVSYYGSWRKAKAEGADEDNEAAGKLVWLQNNLFMFWIVLGCFNNLGNLLGMLITKWMF